MAAKNQILLISCIQFLKEATTCGLTHLSKKMVACIVLSKTQYVGHTLHTLVRIFLPINIMHVQGDLVSNKISGMGIDLYLHCVKFFASFFNRMPQVNSNCLK